MTSDEWDAVAGSCTEHAERQRAKINRYGLGTRAPQYMFDTLNNFEHRAQEARRNSAKAWEEERERRTPSGKGCAKPPDPPRPPRQKTPQTPT